MARWRGSQTEQLLEENAGCFRWLALAIAVGLVLRFLADYLSGASWCSRPRVPIMQLETRVWVTTKEPT